MQNLKNNIFQNYYSKILLLFAAIFKKRAIDSNFKNETEINPEYFWKILLFIFSAGLVLILALNLYFLNYLSKMEFEEAAVKESSYKIRKNDFKEILENYEARKAELQKLILEKPLISEP